MPLKVRPIKPEEVWQKKQMDFPDAVFRSFNELIARTYVDGHAEVKQKDVVALMVRKGLKRKEIFDNNWLNIEEAYRKAGWKVVYDSPAWDESYDAVFKFKGR